MRAAVVGAGPAGIYAAGQLDSVLEADVDVIEKLATPWGLVRHGVAPDHQHIKAVSRVFESILARPRVRFFGGVELGATLEADDLNRLYDVIVLATGAERGRRLDIAGRDLRGSVSAAELVSWYNGHPSAQPVLDGLRGGRVAVIGNGNVAVDAARILLSPPDRLALTDIADPALEALRRFSPRELVLVGRRGPADASFSDVEVEALCSIPGVQIVVDPEDLADDPVSELLRAAARSSSGDRTLRFVFHHRPVSIGGTTRVETLYLDNVRRPDDPAAIDVDLVVHAVGFDGAPIWGVPTDPSTGRPQHLEGRIRPRWYVAGWAKRGPSGVIGTNRRCATETVAGIAEDLRAGTLTVAAGRGDLADLLVSRGVDWVDHEGWTRLDEYERSLGDEQSRPRVKVTDPDHQRRIALKMLPRV